MATLVRLDRRVLLPARCMVGRSRDCDLVVRERDVSSRHAALDWNGVDWQLRDLGSRNGTWLDGERLGAGAEPVVPAGARVSFGREGEPWEVHDVAPPRLMARRVGDDAVILAPGGYLALPEPDAPEHCIHREPGGGWVAEHEGGTRPVEDREILSLRDGTPWRLHLPGAEDGTWQEDPAALEIGRLRLRLSFSRDEEHVEAQVLLGEQAFDLGVRAHHYVLLVLARRRLADLAAGVPEPEQGWVRQDELATMLRMTDNHLYISIHRARTQLGRLG
ncbi:MAG: FHA domain-containing protein, partial [Myxococcales bacterium]|nr:FHA domain-containing protein [Myxococcales bacterium]